jgi:hypothetical protein
MRWVALMPFTPWEERRSANGSRRINAPISEAASFLRICRLRHWEDPFLSFCQLRLKIFAPALTRRAIPTNPAEVFRRRALASSPVGLTFHCSCQSLLDAH